MKIYWELEGIKKGGKDNICLASGTKAQCKKAFSKLSIEQKRKFEAIFLQPYNNEERLDFEEALYFVLEGANLNYV